jgi:hypothetical protein
MLCQNARMRASLVPHWLKGLYSINRLIYYFSVFSSYYLLSVTCLNSELIESLNPLDIWQDTLGGRSVVCISLCLDLYNTIQHGDTPIPCAGSEPHNQATTRMPLRLRFIVFALLFSIYVIVYPTTLTVAQIIQYRKTKWLINKCKGLRRKRSWPTIRYCPGICTDWGIVQKKTSLKLAGLRAQIWTRDPPKRRQDYNPLYCDVRLVLLFSFSCVCLDYGM